jgi:hypothetical protein
VASAARDLWAAASALSAYLTTVLPRARRELRALGPLPAEKQVNAEAVAVFATLAPRSQRAAVVRAIIALQVQIDLLDMAEERGGADDDFADRIITLDERWLSATAALPGWQAVQTLLDEAIKRCEQGQIRTHRAAREGSGKLRDWATELEGTSSYRWWEVAAGASSSVAAHALIAAAADPRTTAETASLVDAAYHPPVGALTVFLDDLVDREEDRITGDHSYLDYYTSAAEAAERLALIAGRAEGLLARLPRRGRHRAILAGVAGFYLSAAAAETRYGQTIRSRVLDALGPAPRLLAGFARIRRWRRRNGPGQAGNSPGP